MASTRIHIDEARLGRAQKQDRIATGVLTAIAAIVMRSRLIDSSKASSKTRIVATALTGRIKTHAVTATVTII